MLTIDGSFGEGGGQILRSSLALAIVTGTPFVIQNVRARRKKPGLMRQHLTAVQAAAQICGGRLDGEAVGSTELRFEPGPVRGGEYHFNIGTAGSTTLVLQTVLLPLALADSPSRVILEGGTHNPFAPPFEFLERSYLPLLNRMGPQVRATLERPGFYPAGGGRIVVEITPATSFRGFELTSRGDMLARRARAVVARLPRHIAQREIATLEAELGWPDGCCEIVELRGAEEPGGQRPVPRSRRRKGQGEGVFGGIPHQSPGPGNVVWLELEYEHVTEVISAFGKVGRPAEAVARDAAEQCRRYLASSAPVGEHLTDQLMLPLAIAGRGAFRSTGLTLHAQTHMELIRRFLDVPIDAQPQPDGAALVRIG